MMGITTQILLTAFGGFVVFVLGQITVKFLIEPIYNFKMLLGEIADSLSYYAYVYINPGVGEIEIRNEASTVLRKNATQLLARYYAIPLKEKFAIKKLILSKEDVIELRKCLVSLSNSVHAGDPLINHDTRKKINKILKFDLSD